jgi:hypothetical protein
MTELAAREALAQLKSELGLRLSEQQENRILVRIIAAEIDWQGAKAEGKPDAKKLRAQALGDIEKIVGREATTALHEKLKGIMQALLKFEKRGEATRIALRGKKIIKKE